MPNLGHFLVRHISWGLRPAIPSGSPCQEPAGRDTHGGRHTPAIPTVGIERELGSRRAKSSYYGSTTESRVTPMVSVPRRVIG